MAFREDIYRYIHCDKFRRVFDRGPEKINKLNINMESNGYHLPASSVGRASDYRAAGLGFEPQTGPTLESQNNRGEYAAICKWLDILVFSDKDDKS